ncbi:MAG: hypothetical protein ABSF00_09280 [Candidatus Bathyarchaeia archaeon]
MTICRTSSNLVNLTALLAVEAAKLDVVMKRRVAGWGLADSIVMSTARDKAGKRSFVRHISKNTQNLKHL